MELILISDSKLKIALTPADMQQYSLSCDDIDYDRTETRAAFWHILDEAKHKTGFDAASERIFVQIYASAGGGCEMYVTKLPVTRGGESSSSGGRRQRARRDSRSGGDDVTLRVARQNDEGALIYSFTSAESMLCACTKLSSIAKCCDHETSCGDTEDTRCVRLSESSAYADELQKGRFFLIFSLSDLSAEDDGISVCDYISEYGTKCAPALLGYIKEHCRCICESGAAVRLGELS